VSKGKRTSPKKVDLESLARSYTVVGIQRLGGYLTAKKELDALGLEAFKVLLDRGWGKPRQVKEHTGAGGEGPIVVEIVYQRPKGSKE
jgi:hypothetical protein